MKTSWWKEVRKATGKKEEGGKKGRSQTSGGQKKCVVLRRVLKCKFDRVAHHSFSSHPSPYVTSTFSTINPTWTSSHFHHSSPQSSELGFVIHVDVFGTKEIPAGEHAIDVDSFFHHAHINTYIHPYCL